MSKTDDAFYKGFRIYFDDYGEDQLIEMLQDEDILEVYEALGAISKRKLENALDPLKQMALHNNNLGLKEEAIRTISRIGGEKAEDILEFLKATGSNEVKCLEKLQGNDVQDIQEALGVAGRRKIKKALEPLKQLALYSEDHGVQEEAIRTIRRIGGRKALDILRFLKTTEHKELIEAVLKSGADVWHDI